jgi:hypothetical protein
MINPGGTSATTRFKNDQVRATQQTMGGPGADAARSALQQYHSSPLNPVGQQPQSAPAVNPIISPAPLPTGGPQLPVEQTQNC